MQPYSPSEKTSEVSIELIIAEIRSTRDQQIDELMNERVMMAFLEHYYNTIAVSPVKLAFLKSDLIDLKKTSLDLVFYSSLITQMKQLKTLAVTGTHQLFLAELRGVFQKYVSKN